MVERVWSRSLLRRRRGLGTSLGRDWAKGEVLVVLEMSLRVEEDQGGRSEEEGTVFEPWSGEPEVEA